jgi:hypothetical protein
MHLLSKLLNNDQIHGYQYSQQLAMALKNVVVSCGRGSIRTLGNKKFDFACNAFNYYN